MIHLWGTFQVSPEELFESSERADSLLLFLIHATVYYDCTSPERQYSLLSWLFLSVLKGMKVNRLHYKEKHEGRKPPDDSINVCTGQLLQ